MPGRGKYVTGDSFVVTHPTTISAIGAYDGGSPFTSTESIGIYSDVTGNLVGPQVVFGPGVPGTQIGNTVYESVPEFVLQPGDYSIISTGGSSGGGNDLSGGNSYFYLGSDVNLPGGERFNSGNGVTVSTSEGSGNHNTQSFGVVDPVPDSGLTAILLGTSLAGLGWMRRKS